LQEARSIIRHFGGSGSMRSSLGFDLRALQVFAAVCELRNMTLAAKRLGMTQPAVSYTIKQLEGVMGVKLIDRNRRPLTPTAGGDWLAGAAAQILHDTQQIPIALRHLDKGLALRLRIGLVDSLSDPFVSVMVQRLKLSIHYLSISTGLARIVRLGLLDHSLDLIITNDPLEDMDGVVRHTVLTEPYLVVLPRAIDMKPADISLASLGRQLPLIRWNSQSRIATDIERQLRRMRLDIARRFDFDSSTTILSMVASGLGWSIMPPLSIFERKQLLEQIDIIPFPGPAFSRQLTLFARRGEMETVAERIADMSRQILRDRYIPEMLKAAPWLAGQVVVGR
jgi:DNA-binding transcriptional LysR family regulator